MRRAYAHYHRVRARKDIADMNLWPSMATDRYMTHTTKSSQRRTASPLAPPLPGHPHPRRHHRRPGRGGGDHRCRGRPAGAELAHRHRPRRRGRLAEHRAGPGPPRLGPLRADPGLLALAPVCVRRAAGHPPAVGPGRHRRRRHQPTTTVTNIDSEEPRMASGGTARSSLSVIARRRRRPRQPRTQRRRTPRCSPSTSHG